MKTTCQKRVVLVFSHFCLTTNPVVFQSTNYYILMIFTTNPTTWFVVNDDILYRLVSLTHGRIRDIALLRGERLSPSSEGWQPLDDLFDIWSFVSKRKQWIIHMN